MAGDPWPGVDAEPEADDPWPGIDAPAKHQPKKREILSVRRRPAVVNDDLGAVTGAQDGDTLTTDSGRDVRVWGVDAPELNQPGWDRNGKAVPIGQQSRSVVADMLGLGTVVGDPVGKSYGRAVAPVTVGGDDLGESIARSGDALAAPDFLDAEPDRRFDYMQAERLARQNRLGIHETMHQSPAEYRKAPITRPTRENVAQFWDTPTPEAGMRPEVEQRFSAMVNDRKVTPEQVAAYAYENGGFRVDPADVAAKRAAAEKSGVDIGTNYLPKPKVLTDQGDGTSGAAARGFGSGALAGGLDEAGAVVDSLGLTTGRENVFNSDRRLADIWANNQEQNSAILGFDELEHPYVEGAAQLAGGLAIPFGARAKTAGQLFRVGAGYGAAEGFLGTDGEVGERAIGGAKGTIIGGVVGAVGGKAIEAGLKVAPRFAERAGLKWPGRPVDDVADDLMPTVDESIAVQVPPVQRDVIDIGSRPSPDVPAEMQQPRPAPQAMDAEPGASMSQSAPRQRDYLDMGGPSRMDEPLTDAQRAALAEGVDPRDVVPIPSNVVGDVEEAAAIGAGRFVEAKAPHERGELTSRTVRAWNGAVVPKVGPIDMVGWLRLQGGLKNQGGDLSHMGLTNVGRKMDFAGHEQRFGPLVNDTDGMNLDDAAMRAWEAGYFPDHTDRPSINEFLDALRSTHEGRARNFLPEDHPEIDRFYGAQGERYALEQQRFETGGPVYADKSVPAGADKPFPPVQAYEEWPAGGPVTAGNIRLDKLETPQDIKRALSFTEKRVGFDAATRGRVTQAETERLASEMGMTPDALLSRRKGQALNAEEALAARQILAKSGNELVNAAKRIQGLDDPGDELLAEFRQKWVRHVAIQEQVSGMTAEAGRALGQFKMAANSRAIRGDVLSALARGGGGKDTLKNAADQLIEAAETAPGVFNATAKKAMDPKWRNRVSELYINFLLSNPATHVVNMTSNTLTALAQIPEHAVAATIGKARQAVARDPLDRIIASEVGARAYGLLQGAKEGAILFGRALKTGEPSDFVSKVEGQEYKAIPGVAGEVLRVPTRLLTAEDELFKGIARRMALNGIAVRTAHREGLKGVAAKARIAELAVDPTDIMLHRADDYGRYLTFQTALEGLPSDLSRRSNNNLLIKFFLPFVRTPTNLLKFAAERSPAAPILKDWRKEFGAGGASRDLAIAKALVGTGFGYAMYEGARAGLITGSAPPDAKKSRLLYADGWKPYSIKIEDTYYSYKRLDPFSTTIGVAADLATLPEGMSERQKRDKVTLVIASILGNLANKTWLSGVSDVVSALHEPERYSDRLIQRLVGSLLIPAGVAGIARAMDPVSREVETVTDAVLARVPGMSSTLPARRDVWGREIKSEGGLGPDFMSPVYISTALNDPVNKALLQIDYAPGVLKNEVDKRELTPHEYDRYSEVAGKGSHAALTELVGSADWRAMDDDEKVKAARKVVGAARRDARAQLFGGKGAVDDDDDGSADDWPGQDVPGADAGPASKSDGWPGQDMPQRDLVGDLQKAIPGLSAQSFTSGFRTKDYQADMRRRGYSPASNSGHLDGSSLDIVVPPGKSMRWLMTQVQKVEPNARLLPEGDHLHMTVPGWFGAPVLGGARSAGLVNPNG